LIAKNCQGSRLAKKRRRERIRIQIKIIERKDVLKNVMWKHVLDQ
jgi:hypothetical protein